MVKKENEKLSSRKRESWWKDLIVAIKNVRDLVSSNYRFAEAMIFLSVLL